MQREWRAGFGIEFDTEPQGVSAFEVVGDAEIAGASIETALAVALDLDAEHAGAFGADFVLMRDASGAERHGERSVLNVAAAYFSA